MELPITLAHYLYTGVSNCDPLKQLIMQVQNDTKVLLDFYHFLSTIYSGCRLSNYEPLDVINEFKRKSYNALSESERQTVSNHEQAKESCLGCGVDLSTVPRYRSVCQDCFISVQDD